MGAAAVAPHGKRARGFLRRRLSLTPSVEVGLRLRALPATTSLFATRSPARQLLLHRTNYRSGAATPSRRRIAATAGINEEWGAQVARARPTSTRTCARRTQTQWVVIRTSICRGPPAVLQIAPRVAGGAVGAERLRRALGHDGATVLSALRSQIDDPVGGGDDVEVVLDDDHGVAAARDEPVDDAEHAVDVGRVEAGGRLVHDVDVTGPGQLGGELEALRFAAGELRNSPPCSPECQRPPRRYPAVQLPSICSGLDAVESQGSSSDGQDTSETNASRWAVSRSSGSGPGAELRQVIRQRPAPGRRDGDGELKRRDMMLTQPDFAWSHIPVSY